MNHIRHKLLAKRNIGHIWDSSNNGTYSFAYSVIIILKSVVDGRLIDEKGVWNGFSEVRCKYWLGMGKPLGLVGFKMVLLGAIGHLLRGLDYLLSEKEEERRLGLGEQNLFFVGSIYAGPNLFPADLMFQVPRVVKFESELVGKTRTIYFELFPVRTAVVKRAVEWAVKKPLDRVQKAGDYLRFFG